MFVRAPTSSLHSGVEGLCGREDLLALLFVRFELRFGSSSDCFGDAQLLMASAISSSSVRFDRWLNSAS